MNRFVRYITAILIAGAITWVVSLTDPTLEVLITNFGVYAVGAEITVRYREILWSHDTSPIPSGVFGGVVTAGITTLARAYGPEYNFGIAILGLGLAWFGLATGYWLAVTVETPTEQ